MFNNFKTDLYKKLKRPRVNVKNVREFVNSQDQTAVITNVQSDIVILVNVKSVRNCLSSNVIVIRILYMPNVTNGIRQIN